MPNPKTWDTAYEWKAILILSLAFGLVGLDRFILAPLFPAMMKDLALNYQDLGNLAGILGIAWGVAAMLFGGLADRIGRRNVLVPAVVAFSVLSAASGMTNGLMALLIIRAAMGVAEGPVSSIGVAVAVEASHPKRRGMNNGFFQCTISLFGQGFGPILATQLLLVTSWRNVFRIVGIPGLIVAALIWIIIREPPTVGSKNAPQARMRAPLSTMFRHRNVGVAMIGLLCAITGVCVLEAYIPNYLVDYLHLSSPQMGYVTSAIGFGGAIGQLGMLTASDFIGRRVAILLSFLISGMFLWLFIHTGANPTLLFVFLSLAAMFNFGALAILGGPVSAEAAPVGLIASVAGIVIGAGEIFGGGIAPALAGSIAQNFGIQYTLYLALVALTVGGGASLLLLETAPRKAASHAAGSVSELDRATP